MIVFYFKKYLQKTVQELIFLDKAIKNGFISYEFKSLVQCFHYKPTGSKQKKYQPKNALQQHLDFHDLITMQILTTTKKKAKILITHST